MKRSDFYYFCLVLLLLNVENTYSQGYATLTDSLVNEFHNAWNNNDLEEMVTMLQPDAFFKSPHQLRYGADTMKATVLIANPPRIKDCWSQEMYSKVDSNFAWSIGKLFCNTYDDKGNIVVKAEEKNTEYTYVFTKNDKDEWKIQILFYHE